MRYRISRIAVHQTAMTLALMYGLVALIFVPIIYLISRLSPDAEAALPVYIMVLGPPVYALIAYVAFAICFWIYNAVAKWVGGVELILDAQGGPAGIPT